MLNKPVLIWKDIAPRRIQNWNPARSSMNIERSVPESWIRDAHPKHIALLAGFKREFRRALLIAGFQSGIQRGALCLWIAH
jgi:hypothetical protein